MKSKLLCKQFTQILLVYVGLLASACVLKGDEVGPMVNGHQVVVSGDYVHTRTGVDEQDLDTNLFEEEIFGKKFTLTIKDLPEGNYFITIRLAETYHNSEDARMMRVEYFDEIVADDVDVYKLAGGKNRDLRLRFHVKYNPDVLGKGFQFTFSAKKDNAKLNIFQVNDEQGNLVAYLNVRDLKKIQFNGSKVASAEYAGPTFRLPDPTTTSTARGDLFQNPVIPGFSPDPSICRVGDDFYMVCSSFEYFPGVPVYHSKDLVNWELISYCLTDSRFFILGECPSSSGIYAPVLRYHDGLFYMITTNYGDKGGFYVTAKDPRGPWSEPVWLDSMNADPSLFFDDDGRAYVVHPAGYENSLGLICLMEMDLENGGYKEGQELPGKVIWTGTGGQFPEGPHLYKIGEYYYLMIAEGGTGFDHRETIARSKHPEGPYFPYENNPILTHRDLPDYPIFAAGHADLVQLQDGSWWAVSLGVRPTDWRSPLGRETFLMPVEWTQDGWPILGDNRRIKLEEKGPALQRYPFPDKPIRDDFDSEDLGLEWNYVRNPDMSKYVLNERDGWLRLKGAKFSLDEQASPTALVRRQRHFNLRVSTLLDFNPTQEGEEAGIVFRQTDLVHTDFGVTLVDGDRKIILKLTEPHKKTKLYEMNAPQGSVKLTVISDRKEYCFIWESEDGIQYEAGRIPARKLSVEASWDNGGIMCFTGMMLGLYSTGNGKEVTSPADFAWFDYEPLENSK